MSDDMKAKIEDHDDGGVDVEIKPEAPKIADGAKEVDVASREAVDVDKFRVRLQEIEARAEANRKAREAAEAETFKAKTEVHQVKGDLMTSELHTITNALAAEKAKGDAAERDLAAAYEAGDSKASAKAQRELSRIESRIHTMENGARHLDSQIKHRPAPDIKAPERSDDDPVESMISKLTPKSQAFLRERKDFVADPKNLARLEGAHKFALADGHTPDTDGYFEYIDGMLAPKKKAQEQDGQQPERRRSVPAAPVSRDNSSDVQSSSRVRMSAEEVDVARSMGYTPSEYAALRQKANKARGDDRGIVRFSREQLN